MKKLASYLLCGLLIVGCGMSNLGKGSLIGTGAGAVLGALSSSTCWQRMSWYTSCG